MSQFPPGPPPDYPGGQQPSGPQQPWGGQPPGPPQQQPPGFPPQQPPGPGGPSQPGWGGQQPYPAAGPPSGGSGNGKLILIVVAVVAVLGIGAVLLMGGSGGSGSSPEDAVKDFFDAAKDGDCQGMMELITTGSFAGAEPEQALAECEASFEAGEDFFSPGDTLDSVKVKSEDGDTAVVSVTSTTDGEATTDDLNLRKEDDKWKIDFTALGDTGTIDPEADLPTDDELPDPDDFDIPDVTLPEDFELPEGLPTECDPTSDDYDLDACTEALGG